MGFNPFRQQRHTLVDIVLVIGTLAVTAALVIWALSG